MDEPRSLKLSDAVRINPPISLDRGTNYPFVEMAALEPGEKYVGRSQIRPFSGGGARFENGDTLMARITPCLENGKLAVYTADGNCRKAHGSTEFIVFRERAGVTRPDFVYYLITSPAVREYAISQMAGTSGRQRVLISAFDHFKIRLPSLKLQKAIAALLGSLDNKIELNRRMNETLEAIARAIFKDWFVDFGPTRAKAEGRTPYLAREIWDLFPDALDDEDKPEGWRIGTVGHCFDLTMGQSPLGSTYNDEREGLPFFQGRTDFGFRYPENRKFCTAPTRIAKRDDTLVSVRAPVGDINMAWEKCCVGRGVSALRHKSGSRSFTYYFAWSIQQELKQYEHTGTVFGSINKKQFDAFRVVEPTPKIVTCFEKQIGPLDERIRKNVSESRTLAETRDLLLPKLMSGKIRLREAEKAVETVI